MDNNKPYESNNEDLLNSTTAPMTFGDWMLTILLLMIPLVNIILLFVWAFSSETNLNKKNFAKAQLIFMGIGIILSIIFVSCSTAMVMNSF